MADIKFLSDLKLMGGASIKNLRVENLPTASIPVTGIEGQLVYDTDENLLKFWDGTAWAGIYNDGDLQDQIDLLDGRVSAIENAPYASEGFVTGITDVLDGRIDAIETAPYATEGFVTGLTDDLDGRLDSAEGRLDAIENAPYASEGFVTGLTDALDGRLDAIETAPYASEGFVTGLTDGLDGRLDAIETAPYASEGFVTGLTDALDGRLDAIETAPYASESFVTGAVGNHDLDLEAHPRGIKWFTPTQLIDGPVTDTVASQSGVSLTTAGTVVASLEAADPLAWLEFEGTVTVSGTGSATLEVEVQDSLSGVSSFGQITVTRGEAYPFEYMLQAPATGSAKDYDLVFKTVAGTETADFGAIAIDAFGSDPFVVKSELDALDTRVDAIEAWNWVGGFDFTITGDDVETAFSSAPISGNVYAAITVWEDASGQAVLVDLARVYDGGNDETTFTVTFNEAPADGATYTVAMKI